MPIPLIVGEFRVGKEPRFTVQASGSQVCNVWLQSSNQKKLPDGTWERTAEFCLEGSIWGSAAEYAGNLAEGDIVHVAGRVYEHEHNGVKKPRMYIDSITKQSDRRKKTASASAPADDPWASAPATGSYADESPF